jgi:hypothetical protein
MNVLRKRFRRSTIRNQDRKMTVNKSEAFHGIFRKSRQYDSGAAKI